MAYKLEVDGLEELNDTLGKMADEAESVAAMALYDGAGVMADAVTQEAANIKTAPFRYAGPRDPQRLPSPEERQAVVDAKTGIARFDKGGGDVNTSIGYRNAGYTIIAGRRKPIPLIVNSINSGTSFMKKQPFIRKASNANREKAKNAMTEKVESEWSKRYGNIYDKDGGR